MQPYHGYRSVAVHYPQWVLSNLKSTLKMGNIWLLWLVLLILSLYITNFRWEVTFQTDSEILLTQTEVFSINPKRNISFLCALTLVVLHTLCLTYPFHPAFLQTLHVFSVPDDGGDGDSESANIKKKGDPITFSSIPPTLPSLRPRVVVPACTRSWGITCMQAPSKEWHLVRFCHTKMLPVGAQGI